MITTMFEKIAPYASVFAASFAITFILTPIVRELNRKIGMVDKPGNRRINTKPIPRGGGLAIVAGVALALAGYVAATGKIPSISSSLAPSIGLKVFVLGIAIAALGFVDDKFSLPPLGKLIGQLAVAFLVWFWAGLGFRGVFPSIPVAVDCLATVFWIAGAVNAFNLIDGLDGLASGLALIATLGMAGSLFMVNDGGATIAHFAFAGSLLAFLRYNYNPASVFLGDCGSMFIGFTISVLPLAVQTQGSFLVSVGVPLLAMGVPIFDTSLAIVRRSLRHLIVERNASENVNGKVMTADSDHLHHRILRAAKLNQRKAAWILYLFALFLVGVGLSSVVLKSKAAGLWVIAVAIASIVIFKDISRVELFDAGRLLNAFARDNNREHRRTIAKLAIPFYVVFDILALVGVFFICNWALKIGVSRVELRIALPLRVLAVFVCLMALNIYRTAWSRAMSSNYVRLLLACVFGSALGSAAIYYVPGADHLELKAMTLAYAMTSAVCLALVRLARGLVRDVFYAIDCSRLKGRKDVSRVLVYGSGLRYRAFRRELVRNTSANDRIIVGIIDDDFLMRGQYIGGIRVMGTLSQSPEIINALNVDSVVIACAMRPEWLKVVLQVLKPTGVKVTLFNFSEKEIKE